MLFSMTWANTNKVGKLLMEGADLIERRGLAKQVRMNNNGSLCFLGALALAQTGTVTRLYFDSDEMYIASEVTAKVLDLKPSSDRINGYLQAVADWNNKPERTAQEVAEAMRMAAVIANKTLRSWPPVIKEEIDLDVV